MTVPVAPGDLREALKAALISTMGYADIAADLDAILPIIAREVAADRPLIVAETAEACAMVVDGLRRQSETVAAQPDYASLRDAATVEIGALSCAAAAIREQVK